MSTTNAERFEFQYENIATASYLLIICNEQEKLVEYQVEMLANNSISNILPIGVKQKNEAIELWYNITSLISLAQFLKKKKLKRNEFLEIVLSITKALLDCRDYLLYDRCFLLDENYIYINPETLEIHMTYIPIETDWITSNILKELLLKLITVSAEIDDSANDNFLQRIISFLKNEQFIIRDFNNFITDLVFNREQQSAESEEINCSVQEEVEVNIKESNVFSLKNLFNKNRNRIIKEDKNANKGLTGDVTNENNKVLEKNDMQIHSPRRNYETALLSIDKEIYPYMCTNSNGDHEKISICKTPYIIGRLVGQVDYETKNTSVGKIHAEISCHIDCQSENRYEEYYVRDLNSRNGTFINECRIDSNKDYVIKNGDKLSFASSDYFFIVPERL